MSFFTRRIKSSRNSSSSWRSATADGIRKGSSSNHHHHTCYDPDYEPEEWDAEAGRERQQQQQPQPQPQQPKYRRATTDMNTRNHNHHNNNHFEHEDMADDTSSTGWSSCDGASSVDEQEIRAQLDDDDLILFFQDNNGSSKGRRNSHSKKSDKTHRKPAASRPTSHTKTRKSSTCSKSAAAATTTTTSSRTYNPPTPLVKQSTAPRSVVSAHSHHQEQQQSPTHTYQPPPPLAFASHRSHHHQCNPDEDDTGVISVDDLFDPPLPLQNSSINQDGISVDEMFEQWEDEIFGYNTDETKTHAISQKHLYAGDDDSSTVNSSSLNSSSKATEKTLRRRACCWWMAAWLLLGGLFGFTIVGVGYIMYQQAHEAQSPQDSNLGNKNDHNHDRNGTPPATAVPPSVAPPVPSPPAYRDPSATTITVAASTNNTPTTSTAATTTLQTTTSATTTTTATTGATTTSSARTRPSEVEDETRGDSEEVQDENIVARPTVSNYTLHVLNDSLNAVNVTVILDEPSLVQAVYAVTTHPVQVGQACVATLTWALQATVLYEAVGEEEENEETPYMIVAELTMGQDTTLVVCADMVVSETHYHVFVEPTQDESKIAFTGTMEFDVDSSEEEQVVLLPAATTTDGSGIVLLTSHRNQHVDFYTRNQSALSNTEGSNAGDMEVGDACPSSYTGLRTDTRRAIIPLVSFWHVQVPEFLEPLSVYACVHGLIVAVGSIVFIDSNGDAISISTFDGGGDDLDDSMPPSEFPSMAPSVWPSEIPSMWPSEIPSDLPTSMLSSIPSTIPSDMPTLFEG